MGTHPIFESDFDCLTDFFSTWDTKTSGSLTKERTPKDVASANAVSLGADLVGHENIWFAHKGKNTKGRGFRQCRITGCRSGLIRKYGLNVSRRAFREIAPMIGFQKLD